VEIDFEVNESVKVIAGPFRGYVGEIKEILAERGKVKVMISIFGRSTPMDLDFNQIEKNT
jgi:transcriptional antiterminator NusG